MSKTSEKSISKALTWIGLALVLAGAGYMLFRDTTPPTVMLSPSREAVNRKDVLTVETSDADSGLLSLEILLVQNGKTVGQIQKEFSDTPGRHSEALPLADAALVDGPFEIKIMVRDASHYPLGQAGSSILERKMELDSLPPKIRVNSLQHNMVQGGSGLIVYELSEEPKETGVFVGDRFFPGHKQSEKGPYACLFALPYDVSTEEFNPLLMASDQAGNIKKRSFSHYARAKAFPQDKLNLSRGFMERKMPQFEAMFPNEDTRLGQFLMVNRKLREMNRAELKKISLETSPTPLWQGVFLRLPNAATTAGFGDQRKYYFEGEKVDEQTHLGVDLASTKNAPVPAANSGKVVHSGTFGIYGDSIIIDHGLGLQTLYAHLSQLDLAKGDVVEKGQVIGLTGTSGLAGGDHLHFGVIVAGQPVNPLEWWDSHWLRVNVQDKLD